MIHVRVFMFISIVIVLFCYQTSYVDTLSIEIKDSLSGLLGENGTEVECSYTKENVRRIHSVSFMAINRSSLHFIPIATYLPDDISTLLPQGQYLKGRVTLMSITQSSTKAVMIFNKLMCIDDTFYKCRIKYTDFTLIDRTSESRNMSIQVQVPPLKPDLIYWMKISADSSTTSTVPKSYITLSSSTAVVTKENETLSTLNSGLQNDTTSEHNTTPSTTLNVEFSSKINKRTTVTTYSTQQTKIAQGIVESDNITVVCTGDVGKPPGKHIFQKYRSGHVLSLTFTASETSLCEISENCSYYRTSNLTFQVTAKDNNAVIRCVVNSSMAEPDMYIETAPIEVYSSIAPSTTFRTSVSNENLVIKQSNNENTAVIVVGTVCGSIILVLCVILFGVLQNKNKTFRCLLRRNNNDRSVDYVNTIQQQDSSLYEGVGQGLDEHNYEQLSRMEHVYNNINISNN